MEDNRNGVGLLDPATAYQPRVVQLPPGALRRLARLHARMEGSLAVFQAAQAAAQQAQQALRDALAEALEEEGVNPAELGDQQLNVDWRTGALTLP